MPANYSNPIGRMLVVNLDGQPIASVRSKRFGLGWDEVDVSHEEEDGFRHLLAGRTTLTASVSVDGVCTVASWNKLQAVYFANEHARVTLTMPDGGSIAAAGAFLQQLSAGASAGSYATFSAAFLLSGRILYTRTEEGEGGYDWHEHDGGEEPPPEDPITFFMQDHVLEVHSAPVEAPFTLTAGIYLSQSQYGLSFGIGAGFVDGIESPWEGTFDGVGPNQDGGEPAGEYSVEGIDSLPDLSNFEFRCQVLSGAAVPDPGLGGGGADEWLSLQLDTSPKLIFETVTDIDCVWRITIRRVSDAEVLCQGDMTISVAFDL